MEEKLPRFLRVMFSESGFEAKIHLPPLIRKKLVEPQEHVILTSQKGSWVVKIHESLDGKIWFTNEWEDFVKQHDISCGDLAVFEHTGQSGILSFNVMIFYATCCERSFNQQLGGQILPPFIRIMFPRTDFDTKIHLPPLNCKKLVEQEPKEAILTSQKGIWKVNIDESDDGMLWFTKGWEDFVLEHGIAENHSLLFVHLEAHVLMSCCLTALSVREIFSFNQKPVIRLDVVGGRPQGTGQGNPSQLNTPEHIASVKLEADLDEVPPPVKIQKRKSALDKGKGKAKRNQEPKAVNVSSTGQHPQLLTTIKDYNIRGRSPYFHIPADFCKANGLYQNARINLNGPNVEHQVSLKVCKGGKTRYAVITRGWPEFIAGNNLKKGDTCIFKLRSAGSSSNDAVAFDVEILHCPT